MAASAGIIIPSPWRHASWVAAAAVDQAPAAAHQRALDGDAFAAGKGRRWATDGTMRRFDSDWEWSLVEDGREYNGNKSKAPLRVPDLLQVRR